VIKAYYPLADGSVAVAGNIVKLTDDGKLDVMPLKSAEITEAFNVVLQADNPSSWGNGDYVKVTDTEGYFLYEFNRVLKYIRVYVDGNGQIAYDPERSITGQYSQLQYPTCCLLTPTRIAMVFNNYTGTANNTTVCTLDIQPDKTLTLNTILTVHTTAYSHGSIIKIDDTAFAIIDSTGSMRTFSVNSAGVCTAKNNLSIISNKQAGDQIFALGSSRYLVFSTYGSGTPYTLTAKIINIDPATYAVTSVGTPLVLTTKEYSSGGGSVRFEALQRAVQIDSRKFLVAFYDNVDFSVYYGILDVSATLDSVTFTQFDKTVTPKAVGAVVHFDIVSAEKVNVLIQNSALLMMVEIGLKNGTITSISKFVAWATTPGVIDTVKMNGKYVILYTAYSPKILAIAALNVKLLNERVMGILQKDGNVLLQGISDAHTGIRVGAEYYFDDKGVLNTKKIGTFVGVGISPTEIYVPKLIRG
jgi:hypothetical protein